MTRITTLAAIAAMGVSLPPFGAMQLKQSKDQPYGVRRRKGLSGKYTPPMVKTKKQKRKHKRPASQRRRKKP